MNQLARIWRADAQSRRTGLRDRSARTRLEALAARRLRLEPLETRALLAVFTPVTPVDVSAVVSAASQYEFTADPAQSASDVASFTAASNPPTASVGMETARTLGVFADSAAASIARNVTPDAVHLESFAHLEAVRQAPLPDGTFSSRSVNVSYAMQTPQAIRFRVDPSPGENVGDLVGVDLRLVVDGQIAGRDADSFPEGTYTGSGQYTYQFRVLSADQPAARSGSGYVPIRFGTSDPLEDAHVSPLNVKIGTEIEIQWSMSGWLQTSDLRAASTLMHSINVDLQFSAADLSAQALAWNLHTAGSPKTLDFTYSVDAAKDALAADTEIGFYWATGTTLQDVIGSINSPVYRYTIDTAAKQEAGSHSASLPLGYLGAPPLEATHVLMVVDPKNVIAETSETNNVAAVLGLPDIQVTGLDWNTRRDSDPFGGWRGVDGQ